MKRLLIAAVLMSSRIVVASAEDCNLAARYMEDARQQSAASEFGEAANRAQQAVDACPNFDSFELLGELRAKSLRHADLEHAADAFASAIERAPSDQARARSLYNYASLLNRAGDPQNAEPLIRDAKSLDPNNVDISSLFAKIERRIVSPTKEQLVRGLRDSLVRPIHWARAGAVASGSTGEKLADENKSVAAYDGPSIRIPINFETGSSIVDEQTRANINKLADALADPLYAQGHFLFVGHADKRGIEANNVVLSKRRAEAICRAVLALHESLQGRIEVAGRGSSEPMDPAENERAYRANRRLQVILN